MDNSEEKEEKQIDTEAAEIESKPLVKEAFEGSDIEFDENFDVDKVQEALKQQLENAGDVFVDPESVSAEEVFSPKIPDLVKPEPVEIDPKAKKYVIYINPENIDFIEELSLGERKDLINKILADQYNVILKQNRTNEFNKYLRHLIVAIITVIIGFPILFIIVNKSFEVSIENYKQAQKNFIQLYKEKGKIKPVLPNSVEKFKY